MLAKVESSLLQSLADLHIRNEVDDCIRSMLLDVETTCHLQQQLDLHAAKEQLRQTQTEQRATILEANTERLERQDRRLELADHMVVELAKLNRELQQLQQWKEEHEYKVRNYDTVLAKLAQTEEELQEANRVSFGGGAKPRRDDDPFSTPKRQGGASPTKEGTSSPLDAGPATRTLFHDSAEPQSVADDPKESIPEKTPEVPLDFSDFTTDLAGATSDATIDPFGDRKAATEDAEKPSLPAGERSGLTLEEATETELSNDGIPPVTLEEPLASLIVTTDGAIPETQPEQVLSIDEEDKKPAAAAVVLIEEEKIEVPSLMTLDVEVLMNIFGFIDAMDILNTAQINVTMYNKVDNIFGISEDGQTPPDYTPHPAPAPAPKPPPPRQPAASAVAAAHGLSTPSSTASKPAPVESKPSIVDSSSGPLGKGLFAMLQPKPAAAFTSPSGTSKPQQQPINPKVAQSMSAKLSDAEVAAIISMTTKLSKLEKEVNLLRNEKEVLAAKLDGTEAVKQFLIGKVRDVEVKLNRSKEDEIKVTQQIASDQEVIAFLDSRVQELEQSTEDLTKEKSTMQKELETLKVSTSKKITMLSDMLKYEREKLREDEGEWKATKKVLVREVKSCRAQLLALQAERDGFKEQNDMLKRAIVSTGGGSKSNTHLNGPSRARRKLT